MKQNLIRPYFSPHKSPRLCVALRCYKPCLSAMWQAPRWYMKLISSIHLPCLTCPIKAQYFLLFAADLKLLNSLYLQGVWLNTSSTFFIKKPPFVSSMSHNYLTKSLSLQYGYSLFNICVVIIYKLIYNYYTITLAFEAFHHLGHPPLSTL